MRWGFIKVDAIQSDFMNLQNKVSMLIYSLLLFQTHCPGNPVFDFHKYMVRTLEDDFKEVVGIR